MSTPLINKLKELINIIYPVGSIYMSVNTTNPANLFGGTWVQIKDKFILASGSTYANGASGGTASHNHALSSKGYAKISLHGNGTIKYDELGVTSWAANYQVSSGGSGAGISETTSWGPSLGGTTENANNLPPYLAVCVWKRTA